MTKTVEAEFYAVVKPKFGRSGRNNQHVATVDSIRVTGITQKRPAKPDGVVVKLKLQFNEEAFLPLQPAATILIPDSMLHSAQQIEVDVMDENDVGVVEHLANMARGVAP
jgi:hypothetical protein